MTSVSTYWIVIWAPSESFSGHIIDPGYARGVVGRVVDPSGWQMHPSVRDTVEDDLVRDVEINYQCQRSLLLAGMGNEPESEGNGKEQNVPQMCLQELALLQRTREPIQNPVLAACQTNTLEADGNSRTLLCRLSSLLVTILSIRSSGTKPPRAIISSAS